MDYFNKGITLYKNGHKYYVKIDDDGTVYREGFEVHFAEVWATYHPKRDFIIISHKLVQQVIDNATTISISIIYMPSKDRLCRIGIDAYGTCEIYEGYTYNEKTSYYDFVGSIKEKTDLKILPTIGINRNIFAGEYRLPFFAQEDMSYLTSDYFVLDNYSNVITDDFREFIIRVLENED